MFRKLSLAIAVSAAGSLVFVVPAAAEPPSPGGTLFIQAETPCPNGTNLFEMTASENAAGMGGGSGLYTIPNTFPPGDCGTNPVPKELNLNCVEVSGQDIFMSGTYSAISAGGPVTGPVRMHVFAGNAPAIGIDFPAAINGGGWRCGAAKVPMEAATGIVRLTAP